MTTAQTAPPSPATPPRQRGREEAAIAVTLFAAAGGLIAVWMVRGNLLASLGVVLGAAALGLLVWKGGTALPVVVGVVAFLLLYWAATFTFFYRLDAELQNRCEAYQPAPARDPAPIPGRPRPEPIKLSAPTEPARMSFGPLRRAQTVTVDLGSDVPLPGDVGAAAVVVDGPFHEGERSALVVNYAVRVIDDEVKIDLCVDPSPTTGEDAKARPGFAEWLRGTFTTRAGTHTAQVDLRHQGIDADPVTLEIDAQGRYLWLLAPGIVIFPFFAIWLAYPDPPDHLKEWLVPALAGAIATGVAFGTQGFNDASWGGTNATFALIAVMYSTSIAAVATAAKAPSAVEALRTSRSQSETTDATVEGEPGETSSEKDGQPPTQ